MTAARAASRSGQLKGEVVPFPGCSAAGSSPVVDDRAVLLDRLNAAVLSLADTLRGCDVEHLDRLRVELAEAAERLAEVCKIIMCKLNPAADTSQLLEALLELAAAHAYLADELRSMRSARGGR
jgi:hypothetical protein